MKGMFGKIASGIGSVVKYVGIVIAVIEILNFAKNKFEELEGKADSDDK